MRSAAAEDDRPKLITHNLAFHRFILDASENTSLAKCWASLGVEALLTLTIYRDLMSPADVAESHVPIVELLRARRPAAAGREARKHVLSPRQARARCKVGSLSTSVEPRREPPAARLGTARDYSGALAALFLAALALRPQIIGVGPLIPSIQHGLGTTHAIAGLLGTIPVLCMGIFAPLAAYLAARVGTRRAMTLALALIGLVGIARALSPNAWTVVLLTIPVGVGMGIGNAIAPIAVRERMPLRPALGTGAYTTGIQVGSTTAALLAVPLAGILAGWRGALTAFSVVACVLGVAWFLLTRDDPPHARISGRLRLPFRSLTAWLLVLTFGLMGSVYYGLTAWLADAYAERGWSHASTGVLLAMLNIVAIPSSFLAPWLSERYGGRVRWLSILSVFLLVGSLGTRRDPRRRVLLGPGRRRGAGRHVRPHR